jgi:hypothetical protein
MKRFVEGADRGQSTLLPECLDEFVEESNSVRVIDCFVDSLDLADLGFEGVEPAATGRPTYQSGVRRWPRRNHAMPQTESPASPFRSNLGQGWVKYPKVGRRWTTNVADFAGRA